MAWTTIALIGIFLFFVGAVAGWCIEVLFRRFFSSKKWINPGFLTGPYLPLYGFGAVGLYGLSKLPINTGIRALDVTLIILIMGAAMTLIEYIAGLIFIKGMKIRLWDYTNQWGNVQGLICPLFSFFWLVIAAGFYFLMQTPVEAMIAWFVGNIEFAFLVGILCGIFLVDFASAIHLASSIRKFAADHQIVVHYEKLKESIHDRVVQLGEEHPAFMFPHRFMERVKDQLHNQYEQFSSKLSKK